MDNWLELIAPFTPWREDTGELFRFAEPWWLLLLLAIPLTLWLRGRQGKRAAVGYSSSLLIVARSQPTRNRFGALPLHLRWISLALLIFALARPQFGNGYHDSEASGIDIVLAVDLSSSMLALDMEPVDLVEKRYRNGDKQTTRLDAVKEVITEFVKSRPNDRIGIVAFARYPYMVSPLSLNHEWLTSQVERLEIGLIEDKTNIGGAITMAANRLNETVGAKSKILILLTDGDQTAGNIDPTLAADAAAALDIKIYTIAAGTKGRVYTLFPGRNGRGLQLNRRGYPFMDVVQSGYNEDALKEIAKTTGGRFFKAGNKEQLASTYEEIDKMEKTDVEITFRTNFNDMYFWPAVIGLCLLLLEQLLANTRYRTLP